MLGTVRPTSRGRPQISSRWLRRFEFRIFHMIIFLPSELCAKVQKTKLQGGHDLLNLLHATYVVKSAVIDADMRLTDSCGSRT